MAGAVKILWHSNSPATGGGYGVQTRQAVRALSALGHDVVLSCYNMGQAGAKMGDEWEGHLVLPGGHLAYGNGLVTEHARRTQSDVIILLCDSWVLNPAQFEGLNVAIWLPVDCEPLGRQTNEWWLGECSKVANSLTIIAMSKHGVRMLSDAGFDSVYVPHSIDTDLFHPVDRKELRDAQGIPQDAFIVVMVADNKSNRKVHSVQLDGFAKFHRKYPNSYLRLHCDPRPMMETDYNIPEILRALKIEDCVELSDPYLIETGGYGAEYIAGLYQTADVLLSASMGEGFGVPIIEAQACGTPTIATRASAMTELVPPEVGWLVNGTRYWNNMHLAWWVYPDSDDIFRRLERARTVAPTMRAAARKHAEQYDHRLVAEAYWPQALAHIEDLL